MENNNIVLKSGNYRLVVNKKGAEMSSFFNIQKNFEFIWNANPQVWNRHAPVLFPIVGKLCDNKVHIDKGVYNMGQHGFARDMDFELVEKTDISLTFLLQSNKETLKMYPFQFHFYIIYSFTDIENQLKITYKVNNNSLNDLPFSVGAHPGFKLPVSNLSEYEIEFENSDNFKRELLVEGLFTGETEKIVLQNHILQLNKEIFDKDAIVIKNSFFKKISLKHKNSNFRIVCIFNDFSDLGIWAKKGNEDFICLEPWLGYADEIGFDKDIGFKKGLIKLAPNKSFEASFYLIFNI